MEKLSRKLGNANTWLFVFVTVLLISFVGMFVVFWRVAVDSQHDEEYLTHVTQLRLLSQQITQHASGAAVGEEEAFQSINKFRTQYQNRLTLLKDGNLETGMPGTPESAMPVLKELLTLWRSSKGDAGISIHIDELMQTKEAVIRLYGDYPTLSQITVGIVEKTNELLNIMIEREATPKQMYIAGRLLMLLERIANSIRVTFRGNADAINAELQLGDDLEGFKTTLDVLLGDMAEDEEVEMEEEISPVIDPETRQTIEELITIFDSTVQERVEDFLDNSEQLFVAKEATENIINANTRILNTIENLQNAYIKSQSERVVSPFLGNVLAGVVLGLLVLLSIFITRINKARAKEDRLRLEEAERSTKRNQEAILRLLTEISDLADGDLSVNATVTEDFTGAIADALNFSIEAMRDLVVSINETAVQVTSAAQSTRSTAIQLTHASERQAQQIAKAGQAIIGMANSVKKVSANAVESADVAKKSVDIAAKGAKAVQDTITGMDSIREQVQETSKRIKRLGESAQEIGVIVGMIQDIADQTNILALNASIQAAMAGEAGRGFAVVAEEVQQLAERSSNATKQIDALVKTIQSDTNEAVSSMEQSTSGVVAGAKIAEKAGESLTEIEKVSVQLAEQIENISQTSRTQAAVASNISGTMTIIQEITTQTSHGTNETAAAIERLAKLANELKTSVSGFKLPDDAQQAMTDMDDAFDEAQL